MTLHLVPTDEDRQRKRHLLYWRTRVTAAGPAIPFQLRDLIAGALSHPRASADLALVIADALVELQENAETQGADALAMDIQRVVNLLRDQAPILAALGRQA